MVSLGTFPNTGSSRALAVSADGAVVVGEGSVVFGSEAFRWTADDGLVSIGDLPGGSVLGEAWGVSGDGSVVVGRGNPGGSNEIFRWTAGTGMVSLGGTGVLANALDVSHDGSVIVGVNGSEAFRWTAETGFVGLGDLPGGSFSSTAWATSADGSVVVGQGRSAQGNEAFRWTAASGMVGLGDLPGGSFSSTALDVSADGSVVVGRSSGANPAEAFLWTAEDGMRALHDVLVQDYGLELTGWTLRFATGISADGLVIAGFGDNPEGGSEAWIASLRTTSTAVPEPGTLGLLGFGLAALWKVRRRVRPA